MKKRRVYRWLRRYEIEKGRPLPKNWKWEKHQCYECKHVKRYKVYRSWIFVGATKGYDKLIAQTIKGYAPRLMEAFMKDSSMATLL